MTKRTRNCLVFVLCSGISALIAFVALGAAMKRNSPYEGLFVFWWIVSMGPLYLIPSMVAFCRKHPQSLAVALVNLFAGWTIAGWICALIWAFASSEVEIVLPASSSSVDKLEELEELRRKRLITFEEFEQKRAALLATV